MSNGVCRVRLTSLGGCLFFDEKLRNSEAGGEGRYGDWEKWREKRLVLHERRINKKEKKEKRTLGGT